MTHRDDVAVTRHQSTLRIWLLAARLRTLPVGAAPVLVGTALAAAVTSVNWLVFAAALLGAIFIQIGTNLANDYSDARRGADTDDRLGPVRVTAGGLVPPRQVLVATWLSFAIATGFGIYLTAVAGWQLLLIGAVSIVAGLLYTGGPRPYGYVGLGELFVFCFFGLVAVVGSYFVQTETVSWESVAYAVPVGLFAAAVLMVNNIRDRATDQRAGKRTLAVRLGASGARRLFVATIVLAYVTVAVPLVASSDIATAWTLLPLLTLPLAVTLCRTVVGHSDGPSLNGALAKCGALELAVCVLLTVGLLI